MAAATTAAATSGPGKPKSSFPGAFCLALALALAHAVIVSSPDELIVETGTVATLPCEFTSTEEITIAASATWSYRKEGPDARPLTFFYFSNDKGYDGKNTQFTGRITWAGNLFKKDASIKIKNMQPTDNGTYFCDVKNPPDVVTTEKGTEVKVVKKENMPPSSGNFSSLWLHVPVLQFCLILASLPSYLF